MKIRPDAVVKLMPFHFAVGPHSGGELRRVFVFNPGVSNELNSALKWGYISLKLEAYFFFFLSTELVTHLAVSIARGELFL